MRKLRFAEILIFSVFGHFDPLAYISTSYFIAYSESSLNFSLETGVTINFKSCSVGQFFAFLLLGYVTQRSRIKLQMTVSLAHVGFFGF